MSTSTLAETFQHPHRAIGAAIGVGCTFAAAVALFVSVAKTQTAGRKSSNRSTFVPEAEIEPFRGMRLPPQKVYSQPVDQQPYPHRQKLGLSLCPASEVVELDDNYLADMAIRDEAMREDPKDTCVHNPPSGADSLVDPVKLREANGELLDCVVAFLEKRYPDAFVWEQRDGERKVFVNRLRGHVWDIAQGGKDRQRPLWVLGKLTQADWVIVMSGTAASGADADGEYVFASSVNIFSFPGQIQRERIGKPLSFVHHPVPKYAEQLQRNMNKFFESGLRLNKPINRFNWLLTDDTRMWRKDVESFAFNKDAGVAAAQSTSTSAPSAAAPAGHVANMLMYRVERQTLARLPKTGAIAFGIKTNMHTLRQAVESEGPTFALALERAITGLDASVKNYKGLSPDLIKSVLGYLDSVIEAAGGRDKVAAQLDTSKSRAGHDDRRVTPRGSWVATAAIVTPPHSTPPLPPLHFSHSPPTPHAMSANALAKLERLSLVSKISAEVQNHVGVNDKSVAEFLLHVHNENPDLAAFKAALREMDLPDSLLESIHRLVNTLSTGATATQGGEKRKTADGADTATKKQRTSGWEGESDAGKEVDPDREEAKRERVKKFPGLAIPDSDPQPAYNPDEDDADPRKVKVENTVSALEGLISSARREADERDARRGGDRDDDWGWGDRDRDRDRGRGRGDRDDRDRGRDRDDHRASRGSHHHGVDETPQLYKIYTGKVSNMRDFGCFVTLDNVRPQAGGKRWEGMVHVSSISASRVNHPQDVVSRGQPVYVKVLSVAGTRVSLSIKDVDQSTGGDLTPNLRVRTPAELAEEDRLRRERAQARSQTAPGMGDEPAGAAAATTRRKRISSPERFEIKQLIASGVLDPADYPDIDDVDSGVLNYEEKEEELDIEIRDDEPAFLAGQTRGAVQLSPVKIVKNPDGTMNRAAIQGASLAKERREFKSQQLEAEMDVPRDLNQPWVDPMPDQGERTFAQDLRGFTLRTELVRAIEDNQVLVVVGDTGSGKTTQMTQYLAEEGYATRGMIGCTQPRRVAAMSVAKRVAEEVGVRLGEEVGYTIRFEDCTSPQTKIKYMTDGMLLRECLVDPHLTKYSIVILDEAHERTIHTDDPEPDYLDAALITTMQIHLSEPAGDILIFLTGQEEIETAAEVLFSRMKALGPMVPELMILPTSLTIDGIYYVVDPGFVKQNAYDPKLGMDSLVVLKAMGINDLIGFDFMDPPPVQTMVAAMEGLYQLGALDEEGLLTRLGRKMAEFPLEPPLAKMLIMSVDLGCSDEILTIVAMLSVQNIWYRPKEKQAIADQKKAKFHQPEARSLRRAQDIRKQLLGIMDRYRQDIVSCGRNFRKVLMAICGGFFRHAAKKDPQEGYKTLVEGTPVYIHPSSALFNHQPEWVIYHELVMTTKEYMREVVAVDPKWLVEVAPTFFKVADANRLSKRKRMEKIEPLFNRYEKPNEWRISKIKRGGRVSQTFG
ncbi:hypothetical protein M427DRAFT_39076 [Gonapodya prolifera JEL478]|uniref:RNA helicase n=1 Tax=Gonapodya prolifera (strain JEL478) TaxID=1344416 RepID=A0A138ZXZ7_GONPJ|nr:hypothetical protein M427DRAFT_39076 [Gonapodya prolifera JEL478]|eukprot:KXS09372.1 hypothetical protein M427DRAFT_39076 [Gonapodya prolifera JEL478]